MELVVSVGILAILTTTGVVIFMRTLRAASQVEIRKTLDGRARLVLNGLARFLQEGVVVSLDGSGRSACLVNGSGFWNGDSLVVAALDNLETTFSVDASGRISSASALPLPKTVYLNSSDEATFSKMSGFNYFTWYCKNGVPDRLRIRFRGTAVGQEGDSGVGNDYDLEVVMRNSGQ